MSSVILQIQSICTHLRITVYRIKIAVYVLLLIIQIVQRFMQVLSVVIL